MSLDLEGSLRNALERGASIEEAISSLVNAGYNEEEVREAAQIVNPSLLSMANPSPDTIVSSEKDFKDTKKTPKPEQPPVKKLSATDITVKKEKKSGYGLIVLLLVVLILLLLSFVGSLIFKDQLIEFLTNLLG